MLALSLRFGIWVALCLSPPLFAQCPKWVIPSGSAQGTDHFGRSVALDGNLALVDTGLNKRIGRLYDADTGVQRAELLLPFSGGVGTPSLSTVDIDASLAVVGRPGMVHVFQVPAGTYRTTLSVPGLPAKSRFGDIVAVDGDRVVAGAKHYNGPAGAYSGTAFLFDLSNPAAPIKLQPSASGPKAQFGHSVAIDGPWIAVGAPNSALGPDGVVFVFDATTGAEVGRFTTDDAGFGGSVAIDGGRLLVGSSGSPDAHLFDLSTGKRIRTFHAPTGGIEDLALDGDRAALSNGGLQAVWVFDVPSGAMISELGSFAPDWEGFGRSFGLSGPRVLAGASYYNWGEPGGGRAYLLDLCGDPGIRYCSPAQPTSTGVPAQLFALGSDDSAREEFFLLAKYIPANRPSYFLASRTRDFVPNAGGSVGTLCLGGKINRLSYSIQKASSSGVIMTHVRLSELQVMPGETWCFQAWFRDGLVKPWTLSNFSDGIGVTFH